MAHATTTTYDEALRTYYLDALREENNNENILSAFIEKNTEAVSGNEAVFDVHYGRSTGSGSRNEGDALPTANYQKYKTVSVPMKQHYAQIKLSGLGLASTRDSKGSAVRMLDSEVKGISNDIKKETNRMMNGAGYGTLARWRSTASGTSQTLQKKYRGNATGGDGFGSTFGGKYMSERGDVVPVVGATFSGAATYTVGTTDMAVSAVSESTDGTYDTITCTDPSTTEAAGTFYARPSSLGAQSTGANRKEMMGLRGLVTDTNIDDIVLTDGTDAGGSSTDSLQGIDVDTYSWWKSLVDSHSSGRYAGQRALTENMMQKMFDNIEEAAGKGIGPSMIYTTKAIKRELIAIRRADHSFLADMELKYGHMAKDFNGVPLVTDPDAIDGEIYFLTLSDFAIFYMSDYDWMSKNGEILRPVSGYDQYEATLFRYAEMGCYNRSHQGVICDLSYSN